MNFCKQNLKLIIFTTVCSLVPEKPNGYDWCRWVTQYQENAYRYHRWLTEFSYMNALLNF